MLVPMVYNSSERYGSYLRAGQTITAGQWVAVSGTDLIDSDFAKLVLATSAMGLHGAATGRPILGVAYKEFDANASDDEYSTTARCKVASGKTISVFRGGVHRTDMFGTDIVSTTAPGTSLYVNSNSKLTLTQTYAGQQPCAIFIKFIEGGALDWVEFEIIRR